MQVFEISGGSCVDLAVGFEGAADLVLEFAADGGVTEEVVSDAAERRGGCFTPGRSVMGLSN